jgi:multiple sugar transport system permease protein
MSLWTVGGATSVLITLPCLVVFFVAQKQISNGITFTGGR